MIPNYQTISNWGYKDNMEIKTIRTALFDDTGWELLKKDTHVLQNYVMG